MGAVGLLFRETLDSQVCLLARAALSLMSWEDT